MKNILKLCLVTATITFAFPTVSEATIKDVLFGCSTKKCCERKTSWCLGECAKYPVGEAYNKCIVACDGARSSCKAVVTRK